MENLIWLSVSIFCNKNSWHRLLNDGIAPLVLTDKNIANYTIEFNYLSGENMRLSLLTNETDAPVVAKNADEYFKKYFSNAALSIRPIKFPVEGVFMPFLANTVQYGLYPHRTIAADEKGNYELSVNLSQILLDALKDDIIDDETILTFGFYLKMGLIKTISSIDAQFVNSLKPTSANVSDADITTFQESKETLIEMAQDIFYPTMATEMPEWFENWLNSCDKAIKKHPGDASSNKGYAEISGLIYKHLGLSVKMNSLLTFFIDQVLFNENILKNEYAKN